MTFIRLAGLDEVPEALKGAMVAIGNFDGCHRGHQHVFRALKERANAAGVPALMLTFEPHPRDVFAPEPFMFRLTYADQKAEIARALGLDGIVVMPFNLEFSRIEAEDFVTRFLVGALNVRGVEVGADFHFGYKRQGTPAFLKEAGQRHGFDVEILDMLDEGDDHISSTRIRTLLGEGDVAGAAQLLGYHWFLSGVVVTGDQRGRELGFPTANMATPTGFDLMQGVYAVRAKLGNRLLDGVASYGKPMFTDERPPFETWIFDFDEDIYGQKLEVALLGTVRGQAKFSSLDELIAAVNNDAAQARHLLQATLPVSELDGKLGFFR
ncbi:bifunctional riboflavin kinase/FAD synthetase [Devosia sp. ZB163]|uniref:bifunctional riboflavin kinase/FAD synthetase n=1 Tax=Devosia sp. ZB163 TaxID=3025938 RepID=UPI00235F294A|nr:bifunctional riboflavin kinase/FAD synthetase [Devosia sp. ZB163]MDC9823598.1 bifunctional riboflavin kinase/FAD synthetase [Devosia sp. ZB163]